MFTNLTRVVYKTSFRATIMSSKFPTNSYKPAPLFRREWRVFAAGWLRAPCSPHRTPVSSAASFRSRDRPLSPPPPVRCEHRWFCLLTVEIRLFLVGI